MDDPKQEGYMTGDGSGVSQLCLAALTKWKVVLAFALVSCVLGGAYAYNKPMSDTASSEDVITYQENKAYYEEMKELYAEWIKISKETLKSGIPTQLPEDSTRLEEIDNAISILTRISSLKAQLEALEEPTMPQSVGMGAATEEKTKKMILYMLLYGLSGALLGVLIIATYLMLSGTVLSGAELSHRYGLRTITLLTGNKSWVFLKHGRDCTYMKMKEGGQLKIASANLSVYAPDATEILLIGTVDSDCLQRVKEKLQSELHGVSIRYAPSVNVNAESYETLRKHEYVILVEKIFSSRYEEVDTVMKLLHDWKKHMVGSIVTIE